MSKSNSTHSTNDGQHPLEIQSTLTKYGTRQWRVRKAGTPNLADIGRLLFTDATHGWAAGGQTLLRTVDGGETWDQVKIDLPERSEIANITFLDESRGWLILQRLPLESSQNNEFWLMQTADAGRSWVLQYRSSERIISQALLIDQHQGWLVGTRYTGISPLRFELLALFSRDQGKNWVDVSAALNELAQRVEDSSNDAITLLVRDGSAAIVVTSKGEIFKTDNQGQAWIHLGRIPDEPPQTSFRRLTVKVNTSLWVVGGADSLEGVWGLLAKKESGTWIKHRLAGVYFYDALFISEKEVLACGAMPNEGNAAPTNRARTGVVLYSSDAGQSWSVIYRAERAQSIRALWMIDQQHIWASGSDGLILSLS